MEAQYGKFLDMIRAVRINVLLIDILAEMPNYGKILKEILSAALAYAWLAFSRNLLKKQYENFTDDNEDLGENASKQERISNIDVDEGITLVSTHDDAEMFNVDQDLHGKEVFVTKQDENVVGKEVDATQVQVKLQTEFDKEQKLAREKAQKEEEVNIALIETWDDVQAKINANYQLAERLQAEEQQELNDEEKATLKFGCLITRIWIRVINWLIFETRIGTMPTISTVKRTFTPRAPRIPRYVEELSDKKESNEFIKSSVEDLVLIPSESDETSGSDSEYDLSPCDDFSPIDIPGEKSVIFSNPLFNSNNDFTSSDDESLSDEDVPKDNVKIYSNPLFEFDDEYISSDVNPLFDEVLENIKNKDSYDCNLDEPDLLVTPLSDANADECFNPGDEVDDIELLLHRDPSTSKMSVASILEGFTNEPPLEENNDVFDFESK
nr:reverse transcriptase domain-containing protein [Tanacetum cinerariifolium]